MKVAIEFKDEDEWNHLISDVLKIAEAKSLKADEKGDVHTLIKVGRILSEGEIQ